MDLNYAMDCFFADKVNESIDSYIEKIESVELELAEDIIYGLSSADDSEVNEAIAKYKKIAL